MRHPTLMALGVLAAGAALPGAGSAVLAAETPTTKTAYIETPAEKAAHEVVAGFSRTLFTAGPDKAFEQYVSKDYVEHSHLVQMRAGKAKTGYVDAIAFFKKEMGMGGGGPGGPGAPGGAPGGAIDIGQIRVNDEMVTQYGPEGADIFRVVNGKITDHWDASPMEPVALKGENHTGNDREPRGQGK